MIKIKTTPLGNYTILGPYTVDPDGGHLYLTPKELEQLFKKVGKILGKGKDYCPYCKSDLK